MTDDDGFGRDNAARWYAKQQRTKRVSEYFSFPAIVTGWHCIPRSREPRSVSELMVANENKVVREDQLYEHKRRLEMSLARLDTPPDGYQWHVTIDRGEVLMRVRYVGQVQP